MGKTKTAFVGGTDDQPVKKGYDKAAKDARRQARGVKPVEAPEQTMTESVELIPDKTIEHKAPSTLKTRSVKYKEAQAKVDKNRLYTPLEAITKVKDASYSTFDGTMELHIVIKKTGFSTNVTLPFTSGKQKKIEFADEGTIEKLKTGKVDFDLLLATADMMPKLVPFARVLGPRGLMPNPKNGTLVKSKKDAEGFSVSSTTLKTEKNAPVIHTTIGKVSQKDEELGTNMESVFAAINKKQIVKVFLKSTMSPSVRVTVS